MADSRDPSEATAAQRKRALWLGAIVWTALVASAAAWWLLERTAEQEAQTRSRASLSAAALDNTLSVSLRQLAALPGNVARRPATLASLQAVELPDTSGWPDAERAQARERLLRESAVRDANAMLAEVMRDFGLPLALLLDRRGNVVADGAAGSVPRDALATRLAHRNYFADAMSAGTASQYVVGRVSREPGIYFSARVAAADGSALGVVVLKQNTATLNRLFTDASTGPLELVADAHGVLILGNRATLLGRRLPPAMSGDPPTGGWTALYRTEPVSLPWSISPREIDGHEVPVAMIGDVPHVAVPDALDGHPFTAWALSPLREDASAVAMVAAAALMVWLAGLLLLWGFLRRIESLEAALHARRELSELAQALPLTVFRYEQPEDERGRFLFVGSGVERVLGVDAAALERDPTLPWRMAGDPHERPPGEPVEFAVHHGTRTSWVRAHSVPAAARGGSVVHNGYWLDVTDRREAQTRFSAVLEHAPSGYLFFDRRRGVIHCNPATLAMFGAADEHQLRGRVPWFPGMSPPLQADGRPSRDRALELMRRHFGSRERVQSFEWRFQRADGTAFDADVNVIALDGAPFPPPGPARDARWDGEPQFCAVLTDISARKATAQAMQEARAAAEAASRTKTSFLANMSHELRTPMNAIIGMTHLALEDELAPRQRSYVEKAHGAARNLLQILDDILDLSKVEAGHLELERIEFRLESVVAEMADMLGLRAEEKGLELLFSAAPGLPEQLVGDPTRLRQVMVNLGSNAIKFTDRGEVTLGIEPLALDGDEVELHAWVKDTGVGLTADQQSRIFQPFVQADNSTTRRFGGTGLGLTISRQLVEKMGGRLWVESAPGRGATFHFTARFGRVAEAVPGGAVPDLTGRRALLVDDNEAARHVLSRMLEDLGVAVEQAASGAEALERLAGADADASGLPSWILLDWKMPRMDGIDCARRILERHPDARPCFLLVTAFARDDALRAGAGLPLAGVLTKPVTPSSLHDALVQGLHARRPLPLPPAAAARAPSTLAAARKRLEGARVLLVEDHPLNQELARDLLERAGIRVAVAGDGASALESLERDGPFDGVLMDCQMPVMDGYTATERLRANPAWRDLPVIAMTASALAADRERAFAAGMNAHIAKPLDVERMFRTLAEWIMPRATPSAPDTNAPLPPGLSAMRSIDARDGLTRCTGNETLYCRLLQGFAREHADFEATFRTALAHADWGRAEHLAHDLKGLAGNLGARALHVAAGELQAACTEQRADACEAALAGVLSALRPVLREIETSGVCGEDS
jgi:PAS domain S-box-containing protein